MLVWRVLVKYTSHNGFIIICIWEKNCIFSSRCFYQKKIKEEGDAEIAKKLAVVGLACIQCYPIDRSSRKIVVHMLEGGGNKLPIPPNSFASTIPIRVTNAITYFQYKKH